jgi:hypothetical protein
MIASYFYWSWTSEQQQENRLNDVVAHLRAERLSSPR